MRSKAFHFLVATSLLMHYSTTGRAGQLLCVCLCVGVHVCAHVGLCVCASVFALSPSPLASLFFPRIFFHKGLCARRACVRTACVHAPVIVCPLLSGVMIRLLPNRPSPSLWLLMCAQPLKAQLSRRVRGGTWGIFLICLAKLIQPRANE